MSERNKHPDNMSLREFVDTARWEGDRGPENFAYLAERIQGLPAIKQLQFNNGAHVSSILEFMADNPGLVEAMLEWTEQNYEEKFMEPSDDYDDEENDDEPE